jgi:hypothetical protein
LQSITNSWEEINAGKMQADEIHVVKKLQQICPETRLVNHNCVALRQELGL